MANPLGRTANSPRANLSLGLGIGAAVLWVIAAIANGDGDAYGWLWIAMAVVALGALVIGFMSRVDGRIPLFAMIGMAIGGLLVLVFLLFALGILE